MKKLFAALFLLITVFAFGQQKFALVIGNGAYTGISSLRNPVNDANDMEAVLRGLGFDVHKVLDGSRAQMEAAVINLRRNLGASRNSYGFFFYAGHGVESGGENYFIPVDADIQSENLLRDRAVSLNFILAELNDAGNELNMIVLDACRDNPFGWRRSGSRGLAALNRVPTGSIVMYAAASGDVADDGTGRNGLFTGQLLNSLRTPGQSVFHIFDKTMADVVMVSQGRQHPELRIMFPGAASIYLGSRSAAAAAESGPEPASAPAGAARSTAEGFVHVNGGSFIMGSPAGEPQRGSDEGPQRRVTISPFYAGRYPVTQREYEEVMEINLSYFTGPDLPVTNISWFDAVEYCNRRSQREGLEPAYTIDDSGDRRTVTWNRGANGYRLPTEAEWEYACRAGTTTAFSTGNNIRTDQANYNGSRPYNNNPRGENRERTTPAGSFAANPWGLYDMHGNVWEWCWDWFGRYDGGEQTDPPGPAAGTLRVIRGGSWSNNAQHLRSAYRYYVHPSNRDNSRGFRVVRSL